MRKYVRIKIGVKGYERYSSRQRADIKFGNI